MNLTYWLIAIPAALVVGVLLIVGEAWWTRRRDERWLAGADTQDLPTAHVGADYDYADELHVGAVDPFTERVFEYDLEPPLIFDGLMLETARSFDIGWRPSWVDFDTAQWTAVRPRELTAP